ncbi:hypothetical protein TRICI_002670 [Trichomonascus ciferrii]|uniref:Glycoside hydrolase family 17 protein n=1 Tax=Trichomonascus ciferrii TaxID=44093 RepID=A0A642V6B8_9ASCO|nr:hypothetical protein TRICI_002670 [Trichomonascus ciferrii]
MHFSKLLLTSLATLAVAQPVHHLHQKRDPAQVMVTQRYTKVVTAGAGAETPAAQQQQQQNNNNNDAAQNKQAQQQSTTMATSVAPASSSSAAASSSAPSSASSGSSDSGSSSGSSDPSGSGITYSPYSSNGGCKSANEVKSDVSKLSEYSVIRIYGVDCDQVKNVYNALGDNQKVMLGIFEVGNLENDLKTMKDGVNGNWDKVHSVSIGNELVNGGQAKPSEVKDMVSKGKSTLKGFGYNGPVVATDTFIATINNPELCDVGDYIAINAHAYFDGNVEASGAGKWVKEQINRVKDTCGGDKKIYVTESGWPSKGDTNGKAVPSPENLKTAVKSIKNEVGDQVCLFSAFNDMWKSPGYLNVEQYWGILSD